MLQYLIVSDEQDFLEKDKSFLMANGKVTLAPVLGQVEGHQRFLNAASAFRNHSWEVVSPHNA